MSSDERLTGVNRVKVEYEQYSLTNSMARNVFARGLYGQGNLAGAAFILHWHETSIVTVARPYQMGSL